MQKYIFTKQKKGNLNSRPLGIRANALQTGQLAWYYSPTKAARLEVTPCYFMVTQCVSIYSLVLDKRPPAY